MDGMSLSAPSRRPPSSRKLYTCPSKHNSNCGRRVTYIHVKYSSTLIYAHVLLLHSCTTPSRNQGPTRMRIMKSDESRLWLDESRSRQSLAVSTVKWMSHGSHKPDADESQRGHSGYQCLCCKVGARLGTRARLGC